MQHTALQHERDLGLAYWDETAPKHDFIEFSLRGRQASRSRSHRHGRRNRTGRHVAADRRARRSATGGDVNDPNFAPLLPLRAVSRKADLHDLRTALLHKQLVYETTSGFRVKQP
jgi:hypothetical protein